VTTDLIASHLYKKRKGGPASWPQRHRAAIPEPRLAACEQCGSPPAFHGGDSLRRKCEETVKTARALAPVRFRGANAGASPKSAGIYPARFLVYVDYFLIFPPFKILLDNIIE